MWHDTSLSIGCHATSGRCLLVAGPLLVLAQRGDALLVFLVAPPVDFVDLVDPLAAVGVLELQDLLQRPVEVVGEVGYLLVELVEGVARYPPTSLTLMSTSVPQLGQIAFATVLPSILTRR